MGRRRQWGGRLGAVWGGWALLACLALEQGPGCEVGQYLEKDHQCCSKCPPGQKVGRPCSTESETGCQPCERDHFQAGWTKERHCTPHRYCDQNAGLLIHTPGTDTQDAECRCRSGTHCSGPECQTCRPHKLCGPGEGVGQEASHLEDTLCADCPEGFFSNVSSATAPCQPWSSCADRNLVEKARGTRESDVVCGLPLPPLPTKEAGRTHLLALVLLPLAALVTVGAALGLRHRQCKGGQKEPRDQDRLALGRQQPDEVAFEEDEQCPALPVQETLPGGPQPQLSLEEAKDSRLAVQEQVSEGCQRDGPA